MPAALVADKAAGDGGREAVQHSLTEAKVLDTTDRRAAAETQVQQVLSEHEDQLLDEQNVHELTSGPTPPSNSGQTIGK